MRVIFYLVFIGMMMIVFTIISEIVPPKNPAKKIDRIGIHHYSPIFDGIPIKKSGNKTSKRALSEQNKHSPERKEKLSFDKKKPDKKEIDKPQKTTSNDDYFKQFLKDYKEHVQSKRKYRNDVVVRYYRHLPDGNSADILVDYGFYLHVREVKSKRRYKSQKSNVIHYGRDFPERDIKLITYLLIKNGIPIKKVKRFKNFNGWKRKSIEIGANPKFKNSPTLSEEQIRAISNPS